MGKVITFILLGRKMFCEGDYKGAITLMKTTIPLAHKHHVNHEKYCKKLVSQCKRALGK